MQKLLERMSAHNLDPGEIKADGKIHRFPTWGDRKNETSGTYWSNGRVSWFQDWRTMEKPEIVKGTFTDADLKALNGSFTRANNKVSREALESGVRRIWNAGTEPDGHPYLKSKGITAPPEVKQYEGCLVIPVFGIEGELNGLQRINENGQKKFLTGTRKKGSFFSIAGNDKFIICEGFSTGVSLYEATGASVVVAFDAGNLVNVAKEISKKASPQNIIIAGDYDAANERNIGAEMAEKASLEIGCRVMLPKFQSPDGKKTTDFNDLHLIEGLDIVKEQFEVALETAIPKKNEIQFRLNALLEKDAIDREIERKKIHKDLGVRLSFIDSYISSREKKETVDETLELFSEVEPLESEVDGAELLSDIRDVLRKYMVLPDYVAEPISAWVLLTYCYNAFRILPMLGITSPTKRCGKTSMLEVLGGLTDRSLPASNISPSAVFRTVDKYQPTLLLDEADTFLKQNEELRGLLNSGHTKDMAKTARSERAGDTFDIVIFSTWGPKAIASIGRFSGTLEDRSVMVSLRRKTKSDGKVSKIGINFKNEHLDIRRACKRWAMDNFDNLICAEPDVPSTSNDRMADNWTPLLAIADVAGGEWPELMRKSMLKLLHEDDNTVGIRLLEDIREVFEKAGVDRMFSRSLADSLVDLVESPWGEYLGALTPNTLARLLKPFGISSKNIRDGKIVGKGYELSSFQDAFKRYLPPYTPVQTATPLQDNNIRDLSPKQSATQDVDVAFLKQHNQLIFQECSAVADKKGGTGEDKDIKVMPPALFGHIDPKLVKEIYGK